MPVLDYVIALLGQWEARAQLQEIEGIDPREQTLILATILR